MNQSPPMGRMLRRALPDTDAELRWIESGRIGFASNGQGSFIIPLVIRRSLNTTGRAFRQRELNWYLLSQFRPGYIGGMDYNFVESLLSKPVTKKDILDSYLQAGHYFNNFKPRL